MLSATSTYISLLPRLNAITNLTSYHGTITITHRSPSNLGQVFPTNSGDASTIKTTVTDIQELPNNFFNSIFILTLSSSEKVVLKVSPPPSIRVLYSDINISSVEANVLKLIARNNTTLLVPKLLLFDDSCKLLDSPFVLLSHLPGSILPSFPSNELAGIVEKLASITNPTNEFGHIATVPGKSHASYNTWREAFRALMEAALRDGEAIVLLLPYAEVRAHFQRLAHTLDTIDTAQLVVVDFSAASVLVEEDGKTITGVIDFERAVWEDPGLARYFQDKEEEELEGERNGKKCRRLLYEMYRSVMLIFETFYYGGGTETDAEAGRMFEGFGEV
ncbi:hypothetical protein BDD12DRAFT_877545 [Trichophaea hybrida]|nr:hypothetical protein BDD12DRAFT_877545 [Trichophaea hybrida]